MAEQRSGLRFDIYERVHLPDGLAGIQELEGAELVPHIQVTEEREHAVIRGYLRLSGTYVGDEDEPGCSLEHLIPVEITLPFQRVQRLEDIRVEIEQFDINLLSSRTLNITGVLSLHGIEMLAGGVENWEEIPDEEVVFIHRADENPQQEAQPETARHEESPSAAVESQPAESAAAPKHESGAVEAVGLASVAEMERAEVPEREEAAENAAEEAAPVMSQPVETVLPVLEEQLDDKPEMKVAISAKPTEPQSTLSHLKSLARPPEAASAGASQEAETVSVSAQPDAVEWKKLFIGADNERDRFKKLRICIVQKEETIEQIAQRYRINPREIMLYNRLQSQQVGEGQIIYIP